MFLSIVLNRKLKFRFPSLLQDPSYRDAVENSASFNTRLSIEKKMRLPFLDAQTGIFICLQNIYTFGLVILKL